MENTPDKKAIAAERNVKERDYWLNQLAGDREKAAFYYDNKSAGTGQTARESLTFTVNRDIFLKLMKISNKTDPALHVILAALLVILLEKYTGINDIIIGTPIYRQDIEGQYINTVLPIRTRIHHPVTFKELLIQIKETIMAAVENQNYPIETLLYHLNIETTGSDFPLFDVAILLENIHDPAYIRHTNPNMIFSYTRTAESLTGVVEYPPARYEKNTIRRIIGHMLNLARAALDNIDTPVSAIRVLSAEEQHRLLIEFNDTRRPLDREKCYSQLYEEQAAKCPHRVAAIEHHRYITYGQLNEKANRLAAWLKEKGLEPDQLAAVWCERSLEMLTAILGIFKAGGAYMPLEMETPLQRIKTMLAESEAAVLLTSTKTVPPNPTEIYNEIGGSTGINQILYLDRHEAIPQHDRLYRTIKLAALLEKGTPVDIAALPAVYDGSRTMTPAECRDRVHRLGCFIRDKKLPRESALGVMIENPLHRVIVLLALQTLSIPFVLVPPGLDREKKKQIIETSSLAAVFSESRFVDEIDAIYWESGTLETYILVDHYDYKKSKKEQTLRKVWDAAAAEPSEAVNDYRWSSSYTGQPFSLQEMEQYITNFKVKLHPYLTPETRVLEVGCGHGLVLFEIAPKVGYYYATDLTPVIIEKNKTRRQREKLHHVELKAVPASQIETIPARDFDIFIISSVIHFFPNTIYLEQVIKSAIDLLKTRGIIYLDDIPDLKKKQELHRSKSGYKKNHPEAQVRLEQNDDLYVDTDFFEYLRQKYPEILYWQSSRKLGSLENELTRYRFDVLLQIDKNRKRSQPTAARLKKERYMDIDIDCASGGQGDLLLIGPPRRGAAPWTPTKTFDCSLNGRVADTRDMERYLPTNPGPGNKPGDISYVIYTSGTSGTPKGVMVHHLGMHNHIAAKINDLAIGPRDVIAQTAPAGFDISIWQFLAGLLTGAAIVIIAKEIISEPGRFFTELRKRKVTIWETVPALLTVYLDMIAQMEEKERELKDMRWMILTGEALKPGLVREWHRYYPGSKLLNAYGPTEASDDITHYVAAGELPASQQTVPIGKPIQNTRIYILDKNLSLCPIGVRGEICVAGIGVGRGYWKDPGKTQKYFVPNPFNSELDDPDYAVLYRTGDIGYIREDGEIECRGRLDHQVKIRGNRIELAEIENQLSMHEKIEEAVVTLVEQGEDKYICAYYTTGKQVYAAELREYLTRQLPAYMIPAYFVEMEKIPKTLNGKVRRSALPLPQTHAAAGNTPPRNEIEKQLVGIWSDILGKPKESIGIDANFFEIGGHSLSATAAVARIHKELHVNVPLGQIFRNPFISQLSAYIHQAGKQEYISLRPEEKKEYYPLSPAQKRLYVLKEMDETGMDISYNMPYGFILQGRLEPRRVENSFKHLLKRHDSLRTSFVVINGEAVQQIHEPGEIQFAIEYYDLDKTQVEVEEAAELAAGDTGGTGEKNYNAPVQKQDRGRMTNYKQIPNYKPQITNKKERSSTAQDPDTKSQELRAKSCIHSFIRPFDLARAPLLRAGLIKIAEKKHILILDIHHIISDEISHDIFINDLLAYYDEKELPPLMLQYKDFSQGQNRLIETRALKKQEEYWLKRFEGEVPLLRLPTDYNRPEVLHFTGSSLIFATGTELAVKIKNLVLECKVTLNILLLAAYNVLLSKYTNQETILVGIVTAGRRHADIQHIIGFFVNMLAIKNRLEPRQTFENFLEQVKQASVNAYENQDYQFEELVNKVGIRREHGRHPLIDAVFVLQNQEDNPGAGIKPGEKSDLQATPYNIETKVAHFDLMLQVMARGDTITLIFEYSNVLFKQTTIEGLANGYINVLEQVVKNKKIKLKDIVISHDFTTADPDLLQDRETGFEF